MSITNCEIIYAFLKYMTTVIGDFTETDCEHICYLNNV